MILYFPDPDAVRLALTSGLVPADVTLASAAVSTDDQGRLYVEPSVGLSRATTKVLDRLGVKGSKRHGGEAVREVGSWVELVPLVKEPGTPDVASGAAVLFELPTADDLPAIVTEMLRLGNDRQGFRWFAAAGETDAKRVLLRVVGPPYYTLLRALDGPAGGVRAYLERAPRVWVELGWTHPLVKQVKVADGQFALLTPPATWHFLADAPFRDVYDLAQFPLPSAPVAWEPTTAPDVVTVPLRLTAGNAADTAELWVLRGDPVAQLDTLVRDADERLTQRLMFAVAKAADGTPVAVLRTRPSKLPPPPLLLENAAAFKPYWKLPNLFLPVGRRLHPTLRRDAVRRLLADDPDQVVWLYPDGKAGFTPESVPDAAFRSLEDWVDYVIETEHTPLAAWVAATRFDFDHFVCTEGGPKPKPDKPDKDATPKDDANPAPTAKTDPGKTKPASRAKTVKADPAEYVPPPPEAVAPNEWRVRAKELEEKFLAVDGALDAPARSALWPELAAAYTGAGDASSDAAVCWLNAIWEHPNPPAAWAAAWAKSEFPHSTGPVTAADLDAKLKVHTPAVADSRAMVAGFLAAATTTPLPNWLAARLPAIQKYLLTHEGVLPVRAAWLAAAQLARLAGGDPLGLARARDRLLERLLTEGLRAERDLPGFLRFAGLRDADRLRAVRDKALDLHAAARAWVAHHPPTLPFIDLFFAFGLARLGEADAAKELVEAARAALDRPVPADWPVLPLAEPLVTAAAGRFLLAGFGYRVAQAVAGKPHAGPLPAALLGELDASRVNPGRTEPGDRAAKHATGQAGGSAATYNRVAYLIDRMREESKILEPEEARDPYTVFKTNSKDPLNRELLALAAVRDPAKYVDRVRRLLRDGVPDYRPIEVQFYLLHEVIPVAPRVGEAFTTELVKLVPGVLAAMPARLQQRDQPTAAPAGRGVVATIDVADETPRKQGELVERALFAAAHFGQAEQLRLVVAGFITLLRARPDETRFQLINVVTRQCLRSLRRLGLRDELDRFLTTLQAEVLAGAAPAQLRQRYATKPDQWGAALQTLLNVSAGWLAFGMTDRAVPILNEARAELFQPDRSRLPGRVVAELIRTYCGALGHGPAEVGLSRIGELLRRFDAKQIPNSWTGNPTYSRLHVKAVEEIIWAIVSDEFALGPTGRKWLDDDEYLVRRRVHADMTRERERGGV